MIGAAAEPGSLCSPRPVVPERLCSATPGPQGVPQGLASHRLQHPLSPISDTTTAATLRFSTAPHGYPPKTGSHRLQHSPSASPTPPRLPPISRSASRHHRTPIHHHTTPRAVRGPHLSATANLSKPFDSNIMLDMLGPSTRTSRPATPQDVIGGPDTVGARPISPHWGASHRLSPASHEESQHHPTVQGPPITAHHTPYPLP